MGLDSEIQLASAALVVIAIASFYLLKSLSKAFSHFMSRIERKTSDVAIYLSHINEDKAHMETLAKSKADRLSLENRFSSLFAGVRPLRSEHRTKLRVTIASK